MNARRVLLTIAVGLLVGGFGLRAGIVGNAGAAGLDSFVSRSGAQLLLDGHPYRFSGANIYNANSDGPPGVDANGDPIDAQTPLLGAYAVSIGKPWFTEEFGWPQAVGDAVRADYYAWLYAEQATYGSAGSLFWNLGPEVAGGRHDANPGTPLTWAVIGSHAPGP